MPARPVWEEPEITLDEWSIVLHPDGHAHFAGKRFDVGLGRERARISSMIESFELATMSGRTYSGRVYRLTKDGRNDMHGLLLPRVLWGRGRAAAKIVSPEELELLLAGPANQMRC